MKLSKTQHDVLLKMTTGWQLGVYGGIDTDARLQHGGLGRGGKTVTVSMATVNAIRNRKLIEGKHSFPVTPYAITDAGLAALEAAAKGGTT